MTTQPTPPCLELEISGQIAHITFNNPAARNAMTWPMYEELKEDVAQLVRHQRDLCNKLASDARKVLEGLGSLSEEAPRKLNKEEDAAEKEAFRKFWLVAKICSSLSPVCEPALRRIVGRRQRPAPRARRAT